jgi:hypothetical protein
MSTALRRRLDRLERQQGPPVRQRIVWWDRGDPEPIAEPGEQLTIMRWASDDENELPSPPDGKAR